MTFYLQLDICLYLMCPVTSTGQTLQFKIYTEKRDFLSGQAQSRKAVSNAIFPKI